MGQTHSDDIVDCHIASNMEKSDEKMAENMYKVGVVHVDKEVHGDLLIEAMNLFMLKTIGRKDF